MAFSEIGKKRIPKWLPTALCIVSAVLIALSCILGLAMKQKKEEEAKRVSGGTFVTDGFETVSTVKSVDGKFNVFLDTKSGKWGIKSPDGITKEQPQNTKFNILCDKWRSNRYVVESPLSEYLLLVDTSSMTISTRQYHGAEKPTEIPCWSEKDDHLAWFDELGYNGKIKAGELELKKGLYPVSNGAENASKWGYINENYMLEIALAYEGAMDYSEGIAAVMKDGKWGYINEIGASVLGFEYESVSECDLLGRSIAFSFEKGLAPVKKNGKYGIINIKGEEAVSFVFDRILQGRDGKYVALKEGKWGILTVDKELIEAATEGQTAKETAPAGPAISAGKFVVKTSGSVLNMRMTAEPDSSVVGKLPNGTVVEVIEAVPGRAYISYKNTKGWVSSDFLKEYTEPTTAVQNSTNAENSTVSER